MGPPYSTNPRTYQWHPQTRSPSIGTPQQRQVPGVLRSQKRLPYFNSQCLELLTIGVYCGGRSDLGVSEDQFLYREREIGTLFKVVEQGGTFCGVHECEFHCVHLREWGVEELACQGGRRGQVGF